MLFEYRVSVDDTSDDIRLCSAHMMNTKLARKPTELKLQLASEAARRSDGMFLWLHLLGRELDPGENAKTLRSIVSEMPAEINVTYERDLENVAKLKPFLKERAIAILRWILFAVRPLTVRELAEAIALSVDETGDTYPEDDLPTSWKEDFVDKDYVNSYIRRSCGSLVELRTSRKGESLALQTFHFVHFSVKEFLLRPDSSIAGQSRLEAICFPDGIQEHNRLARLCLQYLCYDVFGEKGQYEDQARVHVYPFLSYAARSWYTHALHNHRMSEDIMYYAQKLFNPATSNWILWSKVFEGEVEFSDEEQDDSVSGDNDATDEEEEDTETDANPDVGFGSPDVPISPTESPMSEDNSVPSSVTFAAKGGDEEEPQELLRAKDPSPIYYASLLGLTDVIKALQTQGLDCKTPGGRFRFPLQATVANDQQQTVEYLLGQGADVSQRGGQYGSAVGAAAALGLDSIMTTLIEAGADLQCKDENGRNPLHLACHTGSATTVKEIMEQKIDLMDLSDSGETPFSEAIESGDRDTVSLLLDHGADPNTKESKGTPALVRAVALGFKEVTEELTKYSADVNAATSTGLTSLQEAAFRDDAQVTEHLIMLGADLDAVDELGWSTLHNAVASKGNTAAKVLLNRGIKADASTNDGWTPLHIAAECGQDELLALLLDKGANIEAENASSWTSLFSAVWAGKYECVKILLAHGADISKTAIFGSTVLDEAIEQGDKEMIHLLLDHGAISHFPGSSQPEDHPQISEERRALSSLVAKAIYSGDQSEALSLVEGSDEAHLQGILDDALLASALFGATAMTESLLDKGASLTALTFNRRTPLHLAAYHGFSSIVKSFIDRGADFRARDIIGSEPLDLSVTRGFHAIDAAKLLVENGALARVNAAPANMDLMKKLEGPWSGTYTYASWMKDRVDPTALTVSFASDENSRRPPLWTCESSDTVGEFQILGHLLADNEVRFVKFYETNGWLYLGTFGPSTRTISGTWGSNAIVRHGSFTIQKDAQ
jgi:ankyrin repeat protein